MADSASVDDLHSRQQIGTMMRGVMALRRCKARDLGSALDLSEASVSDRLNGHVAWRDYELRDAGRYLQVPASVFFIPPEDAIEALRKLEQSACWGVVDPLLGQGDLFEAALPRPDLEVVSRSVG